MSASPLASSLLGLLSTARTIAIVGLSSRPDRPSYEVARYLQAHGYRVIPVNPKETEVLGARAYPALDAVPVPVDIVDIFRQSEAVPAIVAEAVRVRAGRAQPRAIWMQEGVVHEEAAAQARAAGLEVIMDRCLMKEHRRLLGDAPSRTQT